MGRKITPLARISYPNVFTPKVQTIQSGPQAGQTTTKYGCALLFDSSVDLNDLINDAYEEGVAEFGQHFWAMVQQGSIKWPFRDGGQINPSTGQPYHGAGITFINCSSQSKPDVVSRWAEPGTTKPMKITDPAQLWPGEYVKASVTFKAFNRPDSKGVACYLNNLQLWHEGDRIDGRVDAQDDFDAEGEAPAADLNHLNPPQQPQQQQPPQQGYPQQNPQQGGYGAPQNVPAQGPTTAPSQAPAGAPNQGYPQPGQQQPPQQGYPQQQPNPYGQQPPQQGGGGSSLL